MSAPSAAACQLPQYGLALLRVALRTMLQTSALVSMMRTFGSSEMASRSLTTSPVTSPSSPSDTEARPGGRVLPSICKRRHARGHQRARCDQAARRGDGDPVAVQRRRSPRPVPARSRRRAPAAARRDASVRDMPPAVWCSVRRYVVRTYGKRGSAGDVAYALSGALLPVGRRDSSC